jgi:hypothetical protein
MANMYTHAGLNCCQECTHVLACAALIRYTSGFDTTLRKADTTASLRSSEAVGAGAAAMTLSDPLAIKQFSPKLYLAKCASSHFDDHL